MSVVRSVKAGYTLHLHTCISIQIHLPRTISIYVLFISIVLSGTGIHYQAREYVLYKRWRRMRPLESRFRFSETDARGACPCYASNHVHMDTAPSTSDALSSMNLMTSNFGRSFNFLQITDKDYYMPLT
jgi:hypothetical protein